MKNKCITRLIFCLLLLRGSNTSCVSCKVDLVKVAKNTAKVAKYSAALISVLYAYKAVKDTIKSAKLVLPVGKNFTFSDLIKFPFNLLIKLPIGAFKAMKNYFMSFGFGVSAYLLYRLGA